MTEQQTARKLSTLEIRAKLHKRMYQNALDEIYEIDEMEGDRVRELLESYPHG